MTKISFQLTDDSKLPAILAWLNNLGVAENIETENESLSPKQYQMKKELKESLEWIEKHEKGEVKGDSAYDLLKELKDI
jgi:hypothetical protein